LIADTISAVETRRAQAIRPSPGPTLETRTPTNKDPLKRSEQLREDGDDDEIEPRPDFTLPIDEEDDSFQTPPRLSRGVEEDLTQGSIEASRRDHAELGRFGRESSRFSDRFENIVGSDEAELEGNEEGFSINIEDVDRFNPEDLVGYVSIVLT
jgi:hypothetical protein